MSRRWYVASATAVGLAAVAGCPDAGPEDDGNGVDGSEVDEDEDAVGERETVDHSSQDGDVSFVEPEDGETVSSPVAIELAVEELELAPADEAQDVEDEGDEQDPEIRDGHGHLHVLVDVGCMVPEERIPFDDGFHHLDDGGTELELELESGEYDLCAQASDGAHLAYNLTDEITIEVEDGENGDGPDENDGAADENGEPADEPGANENGDEPES